MARLDKRHGYTRVPNDLLDHERLSCQEKVVLIQILSYDHKGKGLSWPCAATLATNLNLSVKQVGRIKKSLEGKGIIKIKPGCGRRSSRYYFAPDVGAGEMGVASPVDNAVASLRTSTSTKSGRERPRGVDTDVYRKQQENTPSENDNRTELDDAESSDGKEAAEGAEAAALRSLIVSGVAPGPAREIIEKRALADIRGWVSRSNHPDVRDRPAFLVSMLLRGETPPPTPQVPSAGRKKWNALRSDDRLTIEELVRGSVPLEQWPAELPRLDDEMLVEAKRDAASAAGREAPPRASPDKRKVPATSTHGLQRIKFFGRNGADDA
jgi:hypothetical protein